MELTAARKWAVGVVGAATLVLGTAQVTSAAQDPAPVPAAATGVAEEFPREGQPNLYTHDVGKLSGFYQALGFTELYRFTLPDGTIAFATLQDGPFYLSLSNIQVLRDTTGLPMLGYAARKQSDLTVLVPDVDALVETMKAHGARVLVPPKDQPWGERQAFITDPVGNLIQISTHRG